MLLLNYRFISALEIKGAFGYPTRSLLGSSMNLLTFSPPSTPRWASFLMGYALATECIE